MFNISERLNPDAVRSPRGLEQFERDAMKRVREECPDVEWLSFWGLAITLTSSSPTHRDGGSRVGAHSYIRPAQIEVWTATEWDRFKTIIRTLPGSA